MQHNGIIGHRMHMHILRQKALRGGRVIVAIGHLHLSTFQHPIYPAMAAVEVVWAVAVEAVAAAVVVVDAADIVNFY